MDLAAVVALLGTFIGSLIGAMFIALRTSRGQQKVLETTTQTAITTEFDKFRETFTKAANDVFAFKDSIIADDRREIATLKSDVANYKQIADDTLREVDTMRAEMRQANAEHDAKMRAMQGQIDGLLKESAEKDRQLNALTKAVQERETLIGGQVQKIDRFERALAEKDAALVEAQTLIGTLKDTQRINEQRTADELQQLRERVRTLEQKVERLTAERDSLISERDTARRELETLRADYTTKATENAVLLQRIEALEAKLRELTAARIEAQPINERDVIDAMRADVQGKA